MLNKKALNPLQFTGERYLPSEQGRIRLEHMHRYAEFRSCLQGKKVLDIACGEGYGSALLAEVAKSVVGVDISDEAIDHASKTYLQENLRFIQGSAIELNFPDASFDAIVSFETIEHLAEQEQMLTELCRVLRPDGILIISSPNRPVYSEESGELNEFHVKELDYDEFRDLLSQHFKNICFYGQRIQIGSMMNSLIKPSSELRAWNDSGHMILEQLPPIKDPVYFVAMCAKTKEISLPSLSASVMYPEDADLVKHYIGFATWAKNANAEVERLKDIIQDLQNQNVSNISWAKNANAEVERLRGIIQGLQNQETSFSKTDQISLAARDAEDKK